MRKIITCIFALGLIALTVIPERSYADLPTNEELQVGLSQEFENFNPMIMSMLATTWMYNMVGRTLMVLNEDAEWEPQLAKKIPSLENGLAERFTEDGVEKIRAVWEIVDNAKWGDGTDLTCRDFKFAREVALAPTVAITERETYEQVEEIIIDENNPRRCTFKYKEAKWNFNQIPKFYALPEHLERPIFEKYKEQPEGYEQHSLYTTSPTNPGLYNGPYVVTEMTLGSHTIFERNPYFFGAPAKINRIITKVISNTGTLEANLRSGTIDMISVLGMSFDQALAFNQRVQSRNLPYNVNFQPSLVYEHLDLNLDNPFLQDVRVRKALVYAIDRPGLTNALFGGKQPPAYHNLAPLDPWFTNDPKKIVVYPYRRREAARLLDDAGWKLRNDGFRYNENGERLELTIMTTAGNQVRELVQVYLQDQWRSIGIRVRIQNEPPRVFFGQTTNRRRFTGVAMYAWVSSPESNPRSSLSCDRIPTEENGWSGQNYPGWCNERVTELLEKLDLEFDEQKRLDIIHEVLYHYTNEVPVIPLYYRSDISVTPTNLRGYQLPGHQFSATNHVERWYLEDPKKMENK